MALLTDTERSLLATWWGLITQGVSGGHRITDITSAAATIAADLGQSWGFQQSQSLATLAGYAFRMERASESFLAADSGDVIDPSMVARAPWGRTLQEQDLAPSWQVKFTMTFTDAEGNTRTEVKTSIFDVEFPETVGDLQTAITQDASGFAQKYEVTLISAQPYQILAV